MGFSTLGGGLSTRPMRSGQNAIRSGDASAQALVLRANTTVDPNVNILGITDGSGYGLAGIGPTGAHWQSSTDVLGAIHDFSYFSEPYSKIQLHYHNLGGPALQFGDGASQPDTHLTRLAPVGVSTTGTFAQSGGRRLSSLGWFNVKDYGALGNGSNDDRAAIQAAIDAAAAATSGGSAGGVVFLPPGDYAIGNSSGVGLVLPNNKHVILMGSGVGTTNIASCTRIKWKSGAATGGILIRNAVDADGEAGFNGQMHNLYFHTNSIDSRLMLIDRAGSSEFTNLRFSGGGLAGYSYPGVELRRMWNSRWNGVSLIGLGGGGTAQPAMRVTSSSASGSDMGTNTLHLHGLEVENCYGTELELDDGTGGSGACVGVTVSNFKMERGKSASASSDWPFIRFRAARNNAIVNGWMTVGGAASGTGGTGGMIIQDGTNARGNSICNVAIEHQSITGGQPATYCIDQKTGTMAVTGCHFDNWGTNVTAAWRIAAAVPRYGAAGIGTNTFYSTTTPAAYLDQRTVSGDKGQGFGPVGYGLAQLAI